MRREITGAKNSYRCNMLQLMLVSVIGPDEFDTGQRVKKVSRSNRAGGEGVKFDFEC